VLNPLLRILTKSPSSALQSTLHALFLPTPFKSLTGSPNDPKKRAPGDVLKPGTLYVLYQCARASADPAPAAATQEKVEGSEVRAGTGAAVLCLRPQSDTLNYSPIFYSTAIRLRTLHLVPSVYISINFFWIHCVAK